MARARLADPPWGVLVLVLALALAALGEREWVRAQAEAAVVLAVVLEAPVLEPLAEAATDEPVERDAAVAGVPTLLVRPPGEGPHPALVFVNGATRHGRHHPTVRRLAHGLARAGYAVAVPDPSGLARGIVTVETLADVVAVARATRGEGPVGFLGVSVGASLALLAAADPRLERPVAVVAGLAPYAELREVVLLATTGHHRVDGRFVPYDAAPFLGLVAARSLAAALPPGEDRRRLLERMLAVPWESQAPLAALRRSPPGGLGPAGEALLRLLANDDPHRFDELYAALPASTRASVRRLSVLRRADRIRADVELASAPLDRYFPLEESRQLVRALPDGRLTVTRILRHAIPEPTPGALLELVRLDAFAARVLRAAR